MKKRLIAVLASFLFVFGMMMAAGQEALAADGGMYEEIGYCEIIAITADGPGSQEFIITNYGAEDDFNWEATSGQKGSLHLGTGASTRLSIPTNDYITVYVDSATGKNDGSFTTSANEYPIEVYASYGGVTELLADGYLSMAQGNFGYTVDENITVNGKLYTCSETTKYLYYGEGGNTLTFNYTEVQQPDKYVDVYFVDERGYMLDSETFTVAPGTITQYVGPDQIEANGKIYNLKDGQNPVIEHDYNSSRTSYSLTFAAETQLPSKPYSVVINYVDSKTQKVVGTDYMSIPVNSSNAFELPEAIEAGGITYQLSAGSPSTITHDFGDAQREYSVSYDVVKEKKEYKLTVNLVDMASGAVIQTETEMVPVDGNIIFDLPSTISDGTADYLLSAGQNTRLTHAYSNPTRTYNIYYNKAGSDELSAYQVSVQYVDVKTNDTLNNKTVNVAAGQGISFTVPSQYTAAGTEYVLLSGQENIVNHAYSSPRRNYMVYYRDINDKENEKTVITQETINETVTEEGETVTIPNVVTVIEYVEGETVTVDENGEEVMIPEEPTPLAPATTPTAGGNNGEVTIPEEPTPLAPTTAPNAGRNSGEVTIPDETTPLASAPGANRQKQTTGTTKTTEKTKSTEASKETEATKETKETKASRETEAVKNTEAAKSTEAVKETEKKAEKKAAVKSEPETTTISDEEVPLGKAPAEAANTTTSSTLIPIVLGCAALAAAGAAVIYLVRRNSNMSGK